MASTNVTAGMYVSAKDFNTIALEIKTARLNRGLPDITIDNVSEGQLIMVAQLKKLQDSLKQTVRYGIKTNYDFIELPMSGPPLTLLYNQVRQVVVDLQTNQRCVNCSNSCREGCSKNCKTTCSDDACATNCSVNCGGNSCSTNCYSSCSTNSCASNCYTACSADNCSTTCSSGGCKGTGQSVTGCMGVAACGGGCGYACTLGQCTGSCGSSCSNGCGDSCRSTCGGTCADHCEGDCYLNCLALCGIHTASNL